MSDSKDTPPERIGLCPDPGHLHEFYVPHGGDCPADHWNVDGEDLPVPLVEYVQASRLEAAEDWITQAEQEIDRLQAERVSLCEATEKEVERLRGENAELRKRVAGWERRAFAALKEKPR